MPEIKKQSLIDLLGFKPTEEQLAKMPETFNVEGQEITWDEAQETFKNEIKEFKKNAIATAIQKRFKNEPSKKEIKPEAVDVEAITKSAREAARKETLISSFVSNNKLTQEEAADFSTLVESSIKSGKTIEEAIAQRKTMYVKEATTKTYTDFGSEIKTEDGKVVDPIEQALREEAGLTK